MSDILTHTQWHVADMHYDDTDPACDVVVVALKGLGGDYVVTCGGPKGVGLVEVITAVRAAAAALIRFVGGDMSAVGAASPNDAMMDTGDQRAS